MNVDFALAFQWFLKYARLLPFRDSSRFRGAEAENADAMSAVVTCYSDGIGVKPDQQRAIEWQEKAAESGQPLVQRQLAVLYKLVCNQQ